MSNDNIRVLGDVEISKSLNFKQNPTEFPANPKPRTLVVKDGQPFLYTEVSNGSGYFSWTPIGAKQNTYLHSQGLESTTWTVTHGLNQTDFAYFVYDNDHALVLANSTVIDANTIEIHLSEAITGTAIVFGVGHVTVPGITAVDSVTINTIVLRDTGGVLTVNNNAVAFAGYVDSSIAAIEAELAALSPSVLTSGGNDIVAVTSAGATITGNLIPSANIAYSLGDATHQWKDLWLSGNTINLGGAVIKTDATTGAVAIIPQVTVATPNPIGIVISAAGSIAPVATTGGVIGTGAIAASTTDTTQASATKQYVDDLTTNDSTLVRTSGVQAIAGTKTFTDDVTISGNLIISGTATTVNSETIKLADNLIDLNSNYLAGTPTESAGIRVMRGDEPASQIRWNESTDEWELSTNSSTFSVIAVIADVTTATATAATDATTKADAAQAAAISTAATDATTKANAAQAAAATDATAKADAAQAAAISTASADATTKANAAQAAAISTAATDATAKVAAEATLRASGDTAAIGTAATDATTKANAAQAAAISTAATDATTKADAAQAAAILAAATDASTKADAAQAAAISTAATDASTKADAAQAAAISTAAADATTKANAAQAAAISTAATDATTKSATAKSEAISAAAIDATTKADAAQAAAIAAVTNGAGAAFDTLKEIQDAMATDAELSAAIAAISNVPSATKLQTARTINGASFDGTVNISFSTSAVSEGTSLYYTDGRARAAVSAGTAISYNNTTGVITNAGVSALTGGGGITVNASTGSITLGSTATSANTAGAIVSRGASGEFSAGVITATATSARYADLAEKYTADADYEPGTVLIFGGDQEVTMSTADAQRQVVGVVSTDPAYIMNSELSHEYVATIALTGRVPVKVIGPVRKGDFMVSAANGYAQACADPKLGTVIGKAIENFDGDIGVIEVLINNH